MIGAWLWITFALAADVRGMTVSCPTWGWEWGSDAMVQTLSVLDEEGVNWVSIHPYARIRADGTVQFEPLDPRSPPDWLARPIREAHQRGMKVMIKPHLAYWGSPFAWRGDIAFDDSEARERFFRTYTAWIVDMARASKGADAFAVGTELGGVSAHEDSWRAIVAAVRAVYTGPLTYASNWDEAGRVAFWDALDVIGVQAYYPLLKGAPTGTVPTDSELDEAWDRVLADLRGLHERTGKHIVFTELGYDAHTTAAHEPWKGGGWSLTSAGEQVQEACLRASLRAVDREPAVIGAFLWKWFPGELQRGDFRMSSPRMRTVIRDAWSRSP
ncbi:MAG: hypothetical protein KTR31_28040 [Myxococcales bacterium]|nr:hypothetical protein [Myxococcales bacterium]